MFHEMRSYYLFSSDERAAPLSIQGNAAQRQLLPLIAVIVGSLRPSACESVDAATIGGVLVNIATANVWDAMRSMAAETAATIPNKMSTDYSIESFLASHIYAPCLGRVYDDTVSTSTRISVVRTVAWV